MAPHSEGNESLSPIIKTEWCILHKTVAATMTAHGRADLSASTV